MTVALGAKGNNFVTGAKTSDVSAEEAYTVRCILCFPLKISKWQSAVFDNPMLWQRRRI